LSARHDEHDVFQGNDERQRPEEERQHTQHVVVRDGHMATGENLLESVKDAGANVTVDDADGTQCEYRERRF